MQRLLLTMIACGALILAFGEAASAAAAKPAPEAGRAVADLPPGEGPSPPETGDVPVDPVLEQKYSAEFQRRVAQETEQVHKSQRSFFYGASAVMAGVLILGLLAIMRARRQQRELDTLRLRTGDV